MWARKGLHALVLFWSPAAAPPLGLQGPLSTFSNNPPIVGFV